MNINFGKECAKLREIRDDKGEISPATQQNAMGILDMDYRDITEVSRRVSKGLPVNITPHLYTHSN